MPVPVSRLSRLGALRPAALPLVLVALWALVAQLGVLDPNLLPKPSTVVATARLEALTAEFGGCVVASLRRTFAGFAIAAVVGLAIGVLLGVSRWAERLVAPTFHAYRQIAPFAWIPLISAWFGGGEPCKIAFIAVAS